VGRGAREPLDARARGIRNLRNDIELVRKLPPPVGVARTLLLAC
jgi:hypothetical protein